MVERILAAATRAPSAHNRQPWRFAILDDETSKHRLAKAMGERLRADRAADGDEMSAIDTDVSRSYSRITGAPVVIVVCADARVMDHYPDRRRSEAEYLMAVQSTAMAVQNLLLAAQSEGLGASIMCAPLFCPDTVAEVLDVPREWRAQMLVMIGTAASGGSERPRLRQTKSRSGCRATALPRPRPAIRPEMNPDAPRGRANATSATKITRSSVAE